METGAEPVISAWGGGCVNTIGIYSGASFVSGTFLVLWGGGHGDYSGNEIYCFGPMDGDSAQWYKPRNPTSPAVVNTGQDGSGNPVARHTYGSLVYIGGSRNWMLSVGGNARSTDANGVSETHTYQFNTASPNSNLPWTNRSTATDSPWLSAYDSTQDCVWGIPISNGNIIRYDVDANTHAVGNFKSPNAQNQGAAAALDTSRGLFFIRSPSVALQGYRTNNGTSNDYYNVSTTGTGPTGSAQAGMLWDPVADAFKVWAGTGKTIYTLTPPGTSPYEGGNAWTWSSSTPGTGSTPSNETTNGTYNRFAYVSTSTIRGYVLLNAANGSIYFFKP
jgi:hypothetical protein